MRSSSVGNLESEDFVYRPSFVSHSQTFSFLRPSESSIHIDSDRLVTDEGQHCSPRVLRDSGGSDGKSPNSPRDARASWSDSAFSKRTPGEPYPPQFEKRRTFKDKLHNLISVRNVVTCTNVFLIFLTVSVVTAVSYVIAQQSSGTATRLLSQDATYKTLARVNSLIETSDLAKNFALTAYQFGLLNISNISITSHYLRSVFDEETTGDINGIYVCRLPHFMVLVESAPIDRDDRIVGFIDYDNTPGNLSLYLGNLDCPKFDLSCPTYDPNLLIGFIPFVLAERPYVKLSLEIQRESWTSAYLFADTNSYGITSFKPWFYDDHQLAFISAADITLDSLVFSLVEFATTLSEAGTCRIYIVQRNNDSAIGVRAGLPMGKTSDGRQCPTDGLVLAASIGGDVNTNDGLCLTRAVDSNDLMISMSAKAIVDNYGGWLGIPYSSGPDVHDITPYEIGDENYLIWVAPYSNDDKSIDWIIVTVFTQSAFDSQLHSIYGYVFPAVGVGMAVFAVVISIWVTGLITNPLKTVLKQLQAVAELNFELLKSRKTNDSMLLEVRRMNEAMMTMTTGLLSFQRYVPQDVVRLLVRLKREAILGVDEAELTVPDLLPNHVVLSSLTCLDILLGHCGFHHDI